MSRFEAFFLAVLMASSALPALAASPVCGITFPGGFSAGSVGVEEVLKRALDPKNFSARELAPIDSERPSKVEAAWFGLG